VIDVSGRVGLRGEGIAAAVVGAELDAHRAAADHVVDDARLRGRQGLALRERLTVRSYDARDRAGARRSPWPRSRRCWWPVDAAPGVQCEHFTGRVLERSTADPGPCRRPTVWSGCRSVFCSACEGGVRPPSVAKRCCRRRWLPPIADRGHCMAPRAVPERGGTDTIAGQARGDAREDGTAQRARGGAAGTLLHDLSCEEVRQLRSTARTFCGSWLACASIALPACCSTCARARCCGLHREVRIHDAAARGGLVLDGNLKVGDHRFESILRRAERRTCGIHLLQRVVDHARSRPALRCRRCPPRTLRSRCWSPPNRACRPTRCRRRCPPWLPARHRWCPWRSSHRSRSPR
jgi:hypothetical protein